LEGHKDLMSAILLAGGTVQNASLSDIKIIRQQEDGSIKTLQVDLGKYFEHGDQSANPPLRASDTIQISEKNRFVQSLMTGPFIMSVVTAGLSVATLIVTTRD
jgi:hypothetical protein